MSLRGSRRTLPKLEEYGTREKFMRVQISGIPLYESSWTIEALMAQLGLRLRNDST